MTLAEIRELNRQVAEATESPSLEKWSPATNWNYAMYAAEKAELFDDQMNYLLKTRNGEWAIERIDRWGYAGNIDISKGETGPIAICKAILFFKEYK